MPAKLKDDWEGLKATLLSDDSNWSVWIDWYEDRLVGRPLIEEIEIGDPQNGQYGRVSFPAEMYKDPPKLNAALKEVIDKYWEKQLQQNPSAEVFDLTPEMKIVSATQSSGLGLTVTPQQQEWYNEFRGSVDEALQSGGNALGAAKRSLEQLLAVLPENMEGGRVPPVFRNTNRLRRTLEAHKKVADSTEGFEPNRLSPDTAHALEDVVESFNNFRIGDDGLMQAEANAVGPQEVEDIREANLLLESIIFDGVQQELIVGEAAEVLPEIINEERNEIATQNHILGRMATEQNRRTLLNFAKSVLVGMRNIDKGIANSATGITVFTTVVLANAPNLIKFLGQFSTGLKELAQRLLTGLA
ncbi:MAG: hypothetical protein ACPGVT_11435 [Maricaulaceae bacterium]